MGTASKGSRAGFGNRLRARRGSRVMRILARVTRAIVARAWWWLRQVSGDAAYENYLRWARRARLAPWHCERFGACCDSQQDRSRVGHGPPPCSGETNPAAVLSPKQFYVEKLERQYARASRCC